MMLATEVFKWFGKIFMFPLHIRQSLIWTVGEYGRKLFLNIWAHTGV